MKIIYITQHFPPEIGAAQGRAYDMSKNLVDLGHDVSVVTTFPNDKKINKLYKKEELNGIKVIRSFRIRDTKRNAIRRLANYLSFASTSILAGIFQKRPDIVYATSPQLFLGLSGYILSKLHRTKFVFEVRDLWVDFAEILGQFKNKKALALAKKLELFLYKKADLMVVVTQGYKDRLISLGIPEEKIIVITNGVDPDSLSPPSNSAIIEEKLKSEKEFIVLYAGNIGAAQGLDCVIDAAAELQRESMPIRFLFIGEGVKKEELKARASELALSNVLFLDSVPKKDLKKYYEAADLGLVILKEHPLFHITIPSKLFDYMAMKTPILIGVNGEARKIVEDHKIGFYFEPENKDSLLSVVKDAYCNKEKLSACQDRLFPTMLMHFNRNSLAKELAEALVQTKKSSQKSHTN
ncbi:glycosyltransferase family 4 protein [Cytobacillus firmus]|uniref:glycosyltransferase family 4 protein n=1 Tax=Cytobacillus firmus TaxID=1399 RepID=UPI003851266D